jgi:cellulose synthase/poly-beta-1,6-N-acetylglucosamine synthase-like glycosyltransferase
VTIILALLLAPFILLTFCFAIEVFAGLRPLQQPAAPTTPDVETVIVVPAHNEESILAANLASLKESAASQARILVVADNCTDSTAEIARQAGVEVIERFDSERRGKGFALDFGRRHMEARPPEIVVVIDADCVIDAQSLDRLIARCAGTCSPSQAIYLQAADVHGSPAVQLSTFAFYVKNLVRQRALQRLAGRVHLVGTGMAFPWAIFERAELATGDIVEDLKLGQELTENGHEPVLVEDAIVWSDAASEGNTLSQRRRWEGGYLDHALKVGPLMFGRGLASGDGGRLWAAINLMIPPFTLLILLDLAMWLLASIAAELTGADSWPLLLLGLSLVFAALALAFAWRAGGSRFVTLGGLARIPLYIAWKVPMYFGFARRGAPKEWMRTGRGEL